MPSGSDPKDRRERERERERERGAKKRKRSRLVTNLRKCSDTSERRYRIGAPASFRRRRSPTTFVLSHLPTRQREGDGALLSPRVDSEAPRIVKSMRVPVPYIFQGLDRRRDKQLSVPLIALVPIPSDKSPNVPRESSVTDSALAFRDGMLSDERILKY